MGRVVLDVHRDQGPVMRLLDDHRELGVMDPGSRLVGDPPSVPERLREALVPAPRGV
jgi:hypothetical protein